MSDQPLHADAIRRYLDEVASELPAEGPQRTLIVVGGALMALLGLRDATRDVDTIERLDEITRDAVERVADRYGLAPKWLNDSAAGFRPAGFDSTTCKVLIERDTLLVLGAPANQIFLMKLNAARAMDTADLRATGRSAPSRRQRQRSKTSTTRIRWRRGTNTSVPSSTPSSRIDGRSAKVDKRAPLRGPSSECPPPPVAMALVMER